MAEALILNSREWTVSELSGALRRTIESEFGFVRVRAEISGYRGPHSSGHAYFCLKDNGAKIDAVIWRSTYLRLRVKPAEGLEVVVTGKVTTFPGKSTYQIIVESLEPAGLGALMALLEERRRRLAAEGLFDQARKRAIPFLPRVIGVITSPTGAVIRDILHRIADRFPSRVILWPVRVQGETSAAEVAAAIGGFNALDPYLPISVPDVLIVARGGGSLEDLWAFNEEIVVRAAAASRIPLVAAVGHETDWTLIDHVADLRAPTPTGAAEMCVPVRAELFVQVRDLARRHVAAALRFMERWRTELRSAGRALRSGEEIIAAPRQRLDSAGSHLVHQIRGGFDRRNIALGRLARRLAAQSPQARMARAAAQVESVGHRLRRAQAVLRDRRQHRMEAVTTRLDAAWRARIGMSRQRIATSRGRLEGLAERFARALGDGFARRQARLAAIEQLLGSLGYRNVLARGFALVRDAAGAPVHTAHAVSPHARLDIEFVDGHVTVTEGCAPPQRLRPNRQPEREKNETRQGVLFD